MKTIQPLLSTLTKFPAEFARGCAAHPVLTGFASAPDLLASLKFTSSASAAVRDAIPLALVTEHQRASHPLWQSLLLLAYEPMFAGVHQRLHDKRDAEARIVLAFLEAIAKIPLAHPPALLALDLRRSVERSVFGTGAAAHEEPEIVPLEEARRAPSASNPEAHVATVEEERLLLAELERMFGAEAPEVLHVLLRARTGREQLVAFVAEHYPDLTSKERARAYARLQAHRRRALLHLEEHFGRVAAHPSSSAA